MMGRFHIYEIMRKIVLAAKKIAASFWQPVSAIVGKFYLREPSRYSSYARRATRDLGDIAPTYLTVVVRCAFGFDFGRPAI